MDDLATALAEAGGVDAPRERIAQLRGLLAAALLDGSRELDRPRSGYTRPVTIAVAPGSGALRAVAPVAAQLRADPDAVSERPWLVAAALVGALAETGATAPPDAGSLDGHLVLEATGADDPELAALAFEEQVSGVDRLRTRVLVVPQALLDNAEDLRAPIGAAHPLVVAHHVAALGGRPADPGSVAEHEEAVLARLTLDSPEVARPHEDPVLERRIARRILQRLDGMGKWGGFHTEFAHLARGFAPSDRAVAYEVGEALLDAGLLAEKPSVGQRHVFLNPRRAADIRRLVDDGTLPSGLTLPGSQT